MSEAVRVHLAQQDRSYEVIAQAGEDGVLSLQVSGHDADGVEIAALGGTLPVADLALLGRLINAAVAVSDDEARHGSGVDQQKVQHSSAYVGWSEEDDRQLLQLAAEPGASVKELAAVMQRSPGAIRSRLRNKHGITKVPHPAV
ncbi:MULTISPECIES: SANT/Myb-like DNA-binding domain-containing protein [unclassified Nonomuraea]|uniref:SANT/Myb-like DNA-binding domain-containing protein n=1 Tax=unclassified Nonomuraea TaxID=2593643 RepID=UPI0033D76248